jgi:hypothetical protein
MDYSTRRFALFGRRTKEAQHGGVQSGYGSPKAEGYGNTPQCQKAHGQSGTHGDNSRSGDDGVQLTAGAEADSKKNKIKFMKQQDVSSTRNALRLAQQAEETGRDTLARLGAQGERIHKYVHAYVAC